jgi:hypothetical protein
MNTTEAEKQALAIYELICATSADRPYSGNSVGEMLRNIGDWRANSEALDALSRCGAGVHLAFLKHSFEWLRAESKEYSNFGVCQTLMDATVIALQLVPKPLPADIVLGLLRENRQNYGAARLYFPFRQFLATLTRDQVSDEIRGELRKLYQQYAPSPTGKIEESMQEFRDRIAELMWAEDEKRPDPGRGPWSQIVFEEIHAKNEITRSGWEALLQHCWELEQAAPGKKWNTRARELVTALGEAEARETMINWLAFGPTPGQPSEARSPIEDSPYQKGVVWCLGLGREREAALAIANFGVACLRKIPMIGAVSQKVGFACVQALGAMESSEAISQLTRLRAKVKYSVARRLIEKSLLKAAERNGITVEELEDISVAGYGLSPEGLVEVPVGDAKATIRLGNDGSAGIAWHNADGKLVKAAPAHIKKAFAKEVKAMGALAKELEQSYSAQRVRLEAGLMTTRIIQMKHWQQYFVEHPLLGLLGRHLIWVFSNSQGWERSGVWQNGEVLDSNNQPVDLAAAERVRLWHPLSSEASQVQQWRKRIFAAGIRQPFRQAFREFYQITEDERKTKVYSNRFAGTILRQHQFASLCRERGWTYRLMGAHFDGVNVPSKKIDALNMHVEFYVDLPSDRDRSLLESGLGEASEAGINLFVGSDQVRFYRDRHEADIEEIPAIVYSEVMRDIDLFTSVCAVGDDETWTDQGERSIGVFQERFDLRELTAITELRVEMLSRVLPFTKLGDRCQVLKDRLEIRGQLGTYHIHLGWGGAMLLTNSGNCWLRIPQRLLDTVNIDLSEVPLDMDYRTEMALRKASVLAEDWKIDDPELIKQLMP